MFVKICIIPIVFFLAYFAVDGLLCLLDPTCEAAVLSKFSDGMNILHLKLGEANDFYNTSWNTSIMILPVLGGYCTNFLFFLLCGLCFKRHKILGAFIVIFIVSLLASLVSSVFFSTDFANNFEDFSQAEAGIRAFVDTVSIVIWILAIGLGAGVFYRLKTLKH